VPEFALVTLNAIRFVPKKWASVAANAPPKHVRADG
jgi:hypothetical protein